ncbi:hypothetical protein BH24GEM3_BH24GEM3_14550 [soil metagenome]
MLLRTQGNHRQARRAFAWAREIAVRMEMPFEEARALLELGRHAEEPEREWLLSRAAEIFEQLGAEHYRARAAADRQTFG